ncbi:Cof-type HAD-IIB family hydrolase [Clostridium sp.]|uniref:Cof-type HAD-IIB family hydrolase n=1 Tax=Clostridium sp. TaxID=1506 RepID=UPI0026140BAB|nr:Cof-type HAD-IIB family hydrolase [Clostridium sp.]
MKYLASDLDGTLFQHDKTIRKEDIEAILRFKEKGNKLIVSTGRGLKGIKEGFKNYPEIEYDYAIGCNGGVIINNKSEIIYENKISSDIGSLIFEELLKIEGILIHFNDEKLSLHCEVERHEIDKDIQLEFPFDIIIERKELVKRKNKYSMIALIVLDKDINKAEEIKDLLIEKFGDKLEAYRNQHYVDIGPKDCSKGNGIKKLLEVKDISIKDISVIGDSYNDLSMFEITENSYTFNYAEKEVQANANKIVESVAECIDNII